MCPPINLSDILFFVEYLQENYKKKLKITFFCGILTFGKTENSLESVLRENVLGNVYSLDLNYDMELEIQGRVHFGKTEDNRANTSEVEVGRLVQSVRQQSL